MDKLKRSAAWNIDWGKLSFLWPIFAPILDPILEKYLSKIQDKMSAWAQTEFGGEAGTKTKDGFWNIVDSVDQEFGLDLDDVTPEK